MKKIILTFIPVFILIISCAQENELIEELNLEVSTDISQNKKLSKEKPLNIFENHYLPCGTTTPKNYSLPLSKTEILKLTNKTLPLSKLPSKNAQLIVNLKYHIVRNSNGLGGIPLSDLDIITKNIQTAFNKNFQSVLNSILPPEPMLFINTEDVNYIDNDEFLSINGDVEFFELTGLHSIERKINIFIVEQLTNNSGSNVAGRAGLSSNFLILNRTLNSHLTTTAPHEVGHCLSLLHTDHLSSDFCLDENYSHDTGDLIVDTPLDLGLTSSTVSSSCFYNGNNTTTSCGETLPSHNISFSIQNIMSGARNSCREGFTIGQRFQMNHQAIISGVGFKRYINTVTF